MPKKLPTRSAQDFSFGSFGSVVGIIDRHTAAGFPALSPALVARRYWQYINFLQSQGFTTRPLLRDVGDLLPTTEIRNSDLTAKGYVFAQLTFDQWLSRAYKDAGEDVEEKWLKKWLSKVKEQVAQP